jgi:hypothetical protein
MKKFFHVLSRDKATSLTNLEASETQHPSERQPKIWLNSTNDSFKFVDY